MNFDRLNTSKVSLEELCSCLERIQSNELLWQYAIISIHNSLQGYLSSGLRNSNIMKTWKKKGTIEWQLKFNVSGQGLHDPKIPDLDYFMKLFDKAFANEKSINRELILYLNDLRNEFIHFNSDNFHLDKASAIECCMEAMKAIRIIPTLFMDIFNFEEQRGQFENLCIKASEILYKEQLLNKSNQGTRQS